MSIENLFVASLNTVQSPSLHMVHDLDVQLAPEGTLTEEPSEISGYNSQSIEKQPHEDPLKKRLLLFVSKVAEIDLATAREMEIGRDHSPQIAQALTRLYDPDLTDSMLAAQSKFLEYYLGGLSGAVIAEKLEYEESSIAMTVYRIRKKIIKAALQQRIDLKTYIEDALLKEPLPEPDPSDLEAIKKIRRANADIQVDVGAVALNSHMATVKLDADNTRWDLKGSCINMDPAIFFPEIVNRKTTERAKKICRQCPVISKCLEEALKESYQFGVKGGKDSTERRKILRSLGKRAPRL